MPVNGKIHMSEKPKTITTGGHILKKSGKILFSSLKGGVGKSTTACAVAAALAKDGFKVVLVDLDFRTRSLEMLLGATDKSVFTISDYIKGNCSADDLLIKIDGVSGGNLYLARACRESEIKDEEYDLIPESLDRLADESEAEYLLCDTGADSRVPSIVAQGFATVALIVSEQSRTAIRAANSTVEMLTSKKAIRQVRLIINNFDFVSARKEKRAGIIEMIDSCAAKCIGVIPEDKKLAEKQDGGIFVDDTSPVNIAAMNISKRLRGINTPLLSGLRERKKTII